MEKKPIRLYEDPRQCSGCGACLAVCPKAAIKMVEGTYGCKYPVIDHAACIGCGKCRAVCAYQSPQAGEKPVAVYAAVGRDDQLIKHSASGGMFASLAMRWIRDGGLVAGAVMDVAPEVQVYHLLSDREEDIRRMQGSKYVQSDAWRCYADVAAALKNGKQVLFTGTPCQVAAIKALTSDPDNLTTIDLICHGVPPVRLLNDYVHLLGRRFHGKVTGFTFRDKSVQREFCARIDVQRGKRQRSYYLRSSVLSYYKHFLSGTLYRENCYSCPYARQERTADMTIGDYWGISKHHAEDFAAGRMPQRTDWSCVLVSTEKGRALLNDFGMDIALYPSKLEWVAEQNRQLCQPTVMPDRRQEAIQRYETAGYAAIETDFMRDRGGQLRYLVRLYRQIRENKQARQAAEGSKK